MSERHNPANIRSLELFDGAIRVLHAGAPQDWHPHHDGGIERISSLAGSHGLSEVRMPRLRFTHDVSPASACQLNIGRRVCRNPEGEHTDGVVIDRPRVGAAMANADCHVGILFHEESRRMAMVHLGLGCIASPLREGSIIRSGIDALGVSPRSLKLWIGLGICGECNGYGHGTDPLKLSIGSLERAVDEHRLHRPDTWMRTHEARVWAIRRLIRDEDRLLGCVGWANVRFGPREGQLAYDNLGIAVHVAKSCGLGGIEVDTFCTASCNRIGDPRHTKPGLGTFHSNVMGEGEGSKFVPTTKRNLALAYLTR